MFNERQACLLGRQQGWALCKLACTVLVGFGLGSGIVPLLMAVPCGCHAATLSPPCPMRQLHFLPVSILKIDLEPSSPLPDEDKEWSEFPAKLTGRQSQVTYLTNEIYAILYHLSPYHQSPTMLMELHWAASIMRRVLLVCCCPCANVIVHTLMGGCCACRSI